MFPLPEWVLSLIWRIGVPLLVTLLRRMGFISWSQALAAKAFTALANTKTYHEPKEFPQVPPEAPTNTHNFTVGEKLEPK